MPRKKHKYHYIYKTTCKVTNRFYVGMHSTNNLEDGYLGSGLRLRRSLYKHGKENHVLEILEHYDSQESLAKREAELVNDDLLKDPLCMNLKPGGFGGWPDESSETKKLWGSRGGKSLSNRLKEDPNLFRKYSETRIRENQIKHSLGILRAPSWIGKKHKKESKDKIGLANSKHQKGESNSQFGTVWITNGIESRKINKHKSLPTNWKYGRIIKNTQK